MNWRKAGYTLEAAAIVVVAAFLASCSSDSPTGTGDILDTENFSEGDAFDAGGEVNSRVDTLLNKTEELAAGDFSSLSRAASRELSCEGGNKWVYTTRAEPKPAYVFDSTYSMELRNAGNAIPCGDSPEQDAVASDQVLFDGDEHVMMPLFEGDPGTSGTIETEAHSALDIQGGGVGLGGSYAITGSGSYTEEIMGTVEGLAVHTRLTARWTVDLTKAAGGCLTGTMTTTMGTYTVVTTWNGTGTYTWEMTQAGSAKVIRSGQGTSGCF